MQTSNQWSNRFCVNLNSSTKTQCLSNTFRFNLCIADLTRFRLVENCNHHSYNLRNLALSKAILGLFFFICTFSLQLTANVQYKFLPMTGFQPTGIGSKCTTNWATTTALYFNFWYLLCRKNFSGIQTRAVTVVNEHYLDYHLVIKWSLEPKF